MGHTCCVHLDVQPSTQTPSDVIPGQDGRVRIAVVQVKNKPTQDLLLTLLLFLPYQTLLPSVLLKVTQLV